AAFRQDLIQDGLRNLPRVLRTAVKEMRTKALVQRNREEHHRLAAEFHQILETYRVGLEAIAPVRRLSEPELVELVYHALNPTDRQLPTTEKKSAAQTNTDWFEGVRLLDLGGILKAVVTRSEERRVG